MLQVIIWLGVFLAAVCENSQEMRQNDGGIIKELLRMRNDISVLQEKLEQQESANAKQSAEIKQLRGKLSSKSSSTTLYNNQPPVNDRDREGQRHRDSSAGFGCFSDVIVLYCANDGIINVTDAYYGKYAEPCSDCCPPNATEDCRESVFENKFSDWVALKYLCDNRTTCSYEYTGAALDDCQEEYLADYMEIYFTCQSDTPEASWEPVGFTAYATESAVYASFETVKFEGIVSNIGNHYDQSSSVFTCPVDGVYVFSVNVKTQMDTYLYIEIWRDSEFLVEGQADDAADVRTTASALVLTECDAGDLVWTQTGSQTTGHVTGGSARYSMFTGYLLQPYA